MTRIALLTSEFKPFHGGVGAYARELAMAASAEGHAVTVLAPDYGETCAAIDAAFPFRVIRYPGGPATMRTLPRRIAETSRLLGRERFEIVHAVDWPFFIPVRLARGRLHGARVVLTVHGTEIIYMQAAKRRLVLGAIGFWRPGWANWVANSRYTADLLLARFPQVTPDRVRAIPLGVAESWTAGRTDRAAARSALGVAADRLVMASLGRVVPRKGHAIVAAALGRLAPAIAAQIDWWVIGPLLDAGYAQALRVATEPLAARTTVFGPLEDSEVKLRLSAADLFCMPGYEDAGGRVEGFGLAFLEAGAYGVPSIATRSGGIPEAVEDGVTGLLVPERDEQAVAAAIERLAADAALRGRMADAARAKADGATWGSVMRRTYDL